MRKNLKKNTLRILSTAAVMAMLANSTAFAGQWKSDTRGWWYQNDDGSYPTNGWQWIDGNGDGVSESYYFDGNGYMLSNTTTPDGYTVNADGAWTQNGTVQTQATGQSQTANLVTSDEYPLKGKVEKYFGHEESVGLCWYWTGPHVIREGVVSAGMTGVDYIQKKAVEDRDPMYLTGLGGYSIAVIAKLAGYPDKNTSSDTQEVAELYNEVVSFMNSFDWKNASDIEKATRICERIHQATYDWDAANEAYTTGWSESLSYGAYGCLVKGKAVCQGYTEAAKLLCMSVGLPFFEMGDVGHTYPLFLVDGIWLANEPTTQNKYFTVADVYEYNPGYRSMLQAGLDTSAFTEITKYQMIGSYCIQTGYAIPTDKEMLSQYGWVGEVFGKISIDFKPEYRTWK